MTTKKEQLKYFKQFVKKWNKGELASSFYDEDAFDKRRPLIDQRTSYQWKLIGEQDDKGHDDAVIGPTIDTSQKIVYAPLPSDAVLSEEDQKAYQRSAEKMEWKQFQKHQKEIVEDLAPKPSTLHENKLEKSKLMSQQRKEKESDDGYSINEYEEDNTFNKLLQKEKERKERQMNERWESTSERLERYRDKEEKTMALLKSMAAANGYL